MSLLVSRSSRALTWGEDWQVKRERKTHLPKRKTHLPSLVAAATRHLPVCYSQTWHCVHHPLYYYLILVVWQELGPNLPSFPAGLVPSVPKCEQSLLAAQGDGTLSCCRLQKMNCPTEGGSSRS